MTEQHARMPFSCPAAASFGANGERKVSIIRADGFEKNGWNYRRDSPPRTPYQSKIYVEIELRRLSQNFLRLKGSGNTRGLGPSDTKGQIAGLQRNG